MAVKVFTTGIATMLFSHDEVGQIRSCREGVRYSLKPITQSWTAFYRLYCKVENEQAGHVRFITRNIVFLATSAHGDARCRQTSTAIVPDLRSSAQTATCLLWR